MLNPVLCYTQVLVSTSPGSACSSSNSSVQPTALLIFSKESYFSSRVCAGAPPLHPVTRSRVSARATAASVRRDIGGLRSVGPPHSEVGGDPVPATANAHIGHVDK